MYAWYLLRINAAVSQISIISPRPPTYPHTHPHSHQGSITYAYKCVEKLYSAFEDPQLKVSVLENHFESTFKPHAEAPVEVCVRTVFAEVLCNCWSQPEAPV